MSRPQANDYAPHYAPYVQLTEGISVEEVIRNHSADISQFFESLPKEKEDFAYADGKWTLKQVLQHVTDTERVFIYRALRFARKDKTPLAGFEEDEYAKNDYSRERDFDSLKEEFRLLRKSTNLFFSTLNEDQLNAAGTASNHTITVNALAFIAIGHLLHHKKIIAERYLSQP